MMEINPERDLGAERPFAGQPMTYTPEGTRYRVADAKTNRDMGFKAVWGTTADQVDTFSQGLMP